MGYPKKIRKKVRTCALQLARCNAWKSNKSWQSTAISKTRLCFCAARSPPVEVNW